MDQPNQSLFNRTYLKILSWVVAIVIVVLTASNQNTTTLPATELADGWIYLTIEEGMDQQLRLTYPVTPAYTEKQTQQRLALQSALTKAATKQSNLSLQWQDDRVILTLPIPQPDNKSSFFDFENLLSDLTFSINQYYPAALQRAAAQRYLALNDIEELALSNLKAQLPAFLSTYIEPINTFNLFSQRPTVLFILKEEQQSLINPIVQQLAARYSQSDVLDTVEQSDIQKTPIRINLQHRSTHHLYLTGQAIRADTDNASRTLTFHYVNQAIQPLIENSSSTYRLLLKPASPIGYSALSLVRDEALKKALNSNLQTYLLENFNSEQLEQIKTSLVQKYRKQLSTPLGRVEQLTSTLFYQEKLQSEDEFRDTLNNISDAQIQTNIEQLFDPLRTIIVRITPP
ncbi:hypothetical protein [Neptunomonas japonica]|uniref:Zinc protease n=1 Tax=Neptunomonas japonica JAMM 1380 TaxID=1441457 RepID=A0A7R6PEQ9_9GAMM|nr:hypothetical protein [Neptunomonas japonica]BBB28163.1 conserved hypothetical protein [Neptunomonas japonica JAMM 1380]